MRYYILYKIIRWYVLELRPSIQAIPFAVVPFIDHGFLGWQKAIFGYMGWWLIATGIQHIYYSRVARL